MQYNITSSKISDRMLGEAARKAEKASRQSLKVATHNLGYRYSIVVSGTDMSFAHHSVQGK